MADEKSGILDEITKIRDENRLFEIFNDSDDFDVRYAIVNLINDDYFLRKICSNENDPLIRSIVMDRISGDNLDFDDFNNLEGNQKITYIETHNNEPLFLRIAENDKNPHVRIAAIYKISDKDLLLKMARNHWNYDTRVVVYKKLLGKSILEEITGQNIIQSRIDLVEEMDNEEYLEDIALNDSSLDVRRAVLEKVNTIQLYVSSMKNNMSSDNLIKLMEDINDESQLRDIAVLSSSDKFLVENAINNIANPSILMDLYQNDSYLIRETAMKKLVCGNVFSTEKIADKISIGSMILRVCNDDVLSDIARHDSDWKVRLEAVEKMSDEDVLADVAKKDSNDRVQRTAFEKITDEDILADVAKNGLNSDVRLKAVKKISDEDVLSDIAMNDSNLYVRKEAVEKISDEDVLLNIARNCSDVYVRIAAWIKIGDDEVLKSIAVDDSDIHVRLAALRGISDDSFLTYIARNDSDISIRRVAVQGISDESVLVDFARNDSDEWVCLYAIEGISDESVLEDIARKSPYMYARRDAVRKISDEEVLSDIALNNSSANVRMEALERISDGNVLFERLMNDSDVNIQMISAQKRDDNDFLSDIAMNHEDIGIRMAAVQCISDKNILADVAMNNSNWNVRSQAIEKIRDDDVLVDIAMKDCDEDVRCKALENIHDEGVLISIFKRDSYYYVRENALKNIQDSDTLKKLLLENYGYLSVHSFSAFERDYDKMIYESRGQGYYEEILDKIPDESDLTDMVHEKLFSDFRVLIVRRLTSEDVLRKLALNDLDYRVRLAAVKNPNLCDKQTFIHLIQSDNNDAVRFEALMRIGDDCISESLLNDLNPVMRIYAFERMEMKSSLNESDVAYDDIDLSSIATIEDENILSSIVKNAPSHAVRKYAFDKITDERILADIVCHSGQFMDMALDKIADNAVLLDIALYSPNQTVQRNAVKRIDDERFLVEAVENNPYNDISSYIIDRIRDESLLEIIALNNSNPFNRKAAVNRIKSQDIITRLGEIESEEVVCTAIVRKTKNNDLLEYIGLSNPCKTVRRYVASVTDDDELMYKFALKEYEFDNRREIISKMTNEEYIYGLLKREHNPKVFNADFEIASPELLIDLVKNVSTSNVREILMKRIDDKSILMDFIYSSPFISNKPKEDSLWKDMQYYYNDKFLCLSILKRLGFKDIDFVTDFIIESKMGICWQVNEFIRDDADIPSIYRILLNCKSDDIRKIYKNKLNYAKPEKPKKKSKIKYSGLGALFGDYEDDDEEAEERAMDAFGSLFG